MKQRWRAAVWWMAATLVTVALTFLQAVHAEDDIPKASEPDPAEAAQWEQEREFWSFKPPVAQERPAVKNRRWPRVPLDFFVLAGLEKRGIAPSAEANRRTLIRRLSYDLNGLPPTPDEVEAFLADTRPDAYERLVERLLASPRFGEHMASLWLPLARYGEDQAHQVGDDTTMFYPNAHRYRQWVIDAFNRDLSYDRFVQLQIAADQVEGGQGDLAALGFLGIGPKYYNRNRIEVQADEWEDRVDTVTRTVLGLTVACARCHDHKFDPIPTEDYYALAGVFASTRMVNKTPDGTVLGKKISADKMPEDALHIVEEGEAEDLNVFIRGRVTRKGPVAERRFLRVLSPGEPRRFVQGSGRRELAECLTERGNPLTARVIVNRFWGRVFGKPLVPTPSNFGHSGMAPHHPELLDDLAVRFMDGGWSIHRLVREFVNSATYRQESRLRDELSSADPANETLARMNRRRLTIEQWRDGVLFVSGDLVAVGGRSMELGDDDNRRRTVHARISRLQLNDMLMQFDYPDANVHAEGRSTTTTASQKLFMLNSPFILRQAAVFAARLADEYGHDDIARIQAAYRLTFGRDPSSDEVELGRQFLRKASAPEKSRWEEYAQVLLVSNEMLYVD